MCFSATASFVTAGITASAGIVALVRVEKQSEVALASVPVLFAAQQAVEGMLWLTLATPADDGSAGLAALFLLFAKVFWPIFAPLAAFLCEPEPTRRRLMAVCVAMGVGVSAYFLWSILSYSPTAHVGNEHIVYSGEPEAPLFMRVAYFVAVALAGAISSYSTIRLFAFIVFIGSLTSYWFYWQAFSSVWCFFAAAASAVIVFHFEQVRQLRRAAAAGE